MTLTGHFSREQLELPFEQSLSHIPSRLPQHALAVVDLVDGDHGFTVDEQREGILNRVLQIALCFERAPTLLSLFLDLLFFFLRPALVDWAEMRLAGRLRCPLLNCCRSASTVLPLLLLDSCRLGLLLSGLVERDTRRKTGTA